MHRTPRDILRAMITRSNRPEQKITGRYRLLVVGAIGSALVVAVTAFSASYQHQYELNIREGQAHWVAGMQPLSVEGLVAAATLTIWFSALLKRKARTMWPAYLVLLVALSQASLMNLAADHRFNWPWIGPEISIWPAAAFFAAYEMAVWIMRHRPDQPDQSVNEGQNASPAPPTPDLAPYDVNIPKVLIPEVTPMENRLPRTDPVIAVNGSAPSGIIVPESDDLPEDELVHTCNGGAGPKGGKKTPGCPRCDAILSGAIAPKGGRR